MLSIADSLKKHEVNFVLVSFDVERDTPERLKYFAAKQGLTKAGFFCKRGKYSKRLCQYYLMHNMKKTRKVTSRTVILVSVLDKPGVLQYQKEGLGENHNQTINTIKKLAEQP